MIRAESDRGCQAATGCYVILAVPLLVESGTYRERCDRILVVDCDPEIQVARVMGRSGLLEAEVRAIISAQASRPQRLAVADDVIDNSGEVVALDKQVVALHDAYRRAAMTKVKANC
jgi:dephospho-CoA kinase